MTVTHIRALFLGLTEREAEGEKRAWTAMDFVVLNENSSRRSYIDRADDALLKAVRQLGASCAWGDTFLFDGDVGAKGNINISAVYPDSI